jgi:sec-independent protein translocase protein TatB
VFDIAWSELALIAAVALIVIGPKDLPRVMRNLGQWMRRARAMAAEFQRNLDDMMREAELDEIRREVENVSPAEFKANLEKMVDAKGIEEAVRAEPGKPAAPEPTLAPGEIPVLEEGHPLKDYWPEGHDPVAEGGYEPQAPYKEMPDPGPTRAPASAPTPTPEPKA